MSAVDDDLFTKQCLSLVGVWKGQGQVVRGDDGSTIVVSYKEECTIEVLKQTPSLVVLQWLQKTKHAEKLTPMHAETGLLKLMKSSEHNISVEAGFTHPFPKGMVTELSSGTFQNGTTLHLICHDKFHRTSDSQERGVTKYERSYRLECDQLIYTQHLDDKLHLKCTLSRAN